MITQQRKSELAIADYQKDLEAVKAKKQEAYDYIAGLVKLEKILKRAIKTHEELAL